MLSQLLFELLDAIADLDCPNKLHFLQLLIRISSPVSLRHLEISSNYLREPGERLAFNSIIKFLLSFRGLQYLCLKISNFSRVLPGLDNAIRHHRSTLQGLVFHKRRLMLINSKRTFKELRDVTLASPNILRILQNSGSPIAFSLCLHPARAWNLLLDSPMRSSIQILHLRFSGEEKLHRAIRREIFIRLVRWAFGPAGLPALQILAFSDFSHGHRYREQQVLLRRKRANKSSTAKRLSDGDHSTGHCRANQAFYLADIDDDSL
ncbi:hypothetical protein BJX96DRAFT_169655 [Aspergillus floccosus]